MQSHRNGVEMESKCHRNCTEISSNFIEFDYFVYEMSRNCISRNFIETESKCSRIESVFSKKKHRKGVEMATKCNRNVIEMASKYRRISSNSTVLFMNLVETA